MSNNKFEFVIFVSNNDDGDARREKDDIVLARVSTNTTTL